MSVPLLAPKRVGTTRLPASTGLGAVLVTGDAAAHTKGVWVEVIAATSGPGSLICIEVYASTSLGVNTSMLLDIGFGAAGSERVEIANLGVGYTAGNGLESKGRCWKIPLFVPSGTRISARIQGAVVSDTISIAVDVFGGLSSLPTFARCTTYGANTATSRGVTLVCTVANTKGAWQVIDAATARAIKALVTSFQCAGLSTVNARPHLVDIGYGGVGSEIIVVNDLYVHNNSNEIILDAIPANEVYLSTPIPAGSRLVARHSSTAADSQIDLTLHGLE